jgi:hypothetical protein
MAPTEVPSSFVQELAEFLSTQPSRRELLDYHPSKAVQKRASELLLKQNEGDISYSELQELEEFAVTERLVRLLKARLRNVKTRL